MKHFMSASALGFNPDSMVVTSPEAAFTLARLALISPIASSGKFYFHNELHEAPRSLEYIYLSYLLHLLHSHQHRRFAQP